MKHVKMVLIVSSVLLSGLLLQCLGLMSQPDFAHYSVLEWIFQTLWIIILVSSGLLISKLEQDAK